MGARRFAAYALAATIVGCALGEESPPTPEPGSVVFQIEAVDASNAGRVGWVATHRAEGKTARFRIELQPEPRGARLPAFVQCSLGRESDSDASILLRDLSRALGGRVPTLGPGVGELDVPAVVLARDLSRGGGGDQVAGIFGSEPRGDWIATKLFLGDGDGEVFLNLDPITGYGEFSIKDPAYAGPVLRELGRLLQGEVTADSTAPPEPARPAADPRPSATPASTPDRFAPRVAALSEQAAPGVRQPERRKALKGLASFGPRAREAVSLFLQALEDEDPLIRGEALSGLPSLRPPTQRGIAAVTPLLEDSYPLNQVKAANALADFGQIEVAATHLTTFLKGEAKSAAAAGLSRLGPEARGAVPQLTEMLEQRQNPYDADAACRALAAIGRDASSALPALRAASQDTNQHVRKIASYAIREIEGH